MIKKLMFLVGLVIFSVSVIGYAGQPQDKLIIYYFHRTVRCPSCILLEELTRNSVTTGFDTEMKNGRVELKIINIDEPNNSHFESHYNLPYQSVIVSSVVNGIETKWKNLSQVWDFLHEEDKFTNYVQKEIRLFLKESKG